MQQHKHRTTALVRMQPGPSPPPDVKDVLGAMPERNQPTRVVAASNAASGPWLAIVSLTFISVGAALAGLMVWKLTDASWLGLLIGFGLWLAAGSFVIITMNGDLPAVLEIKESEKTERKRVGAAEDIAHRHYDLAEKSEKNRHEEAMAQIDADYRLSDLQDHMRAIYAAVQQLTVSGSALGEGKGSFSVTKSFPAKEAVAAFLLSLYGDDGLPAPEYIHPKGNLKYGVPWRSSGGEWNRETWGDEAMEMCTKSRHGAEPVLAPALHQGQVRGWILNIERYPTKASIIEWVSRFK